MDGNVDDNCCWSQPNRAALPPIDQHGSNDSMFYGENYQLHYDDGVYDEFGHPLGVVVGDNPPGFSNANTNGAIPPPETFMETCPEEEEGDNDGVSGGGGGGDDERIRFKFVTEEEADAKRREIAERVRTYIMTGNGGITTYNRIITQNIQDNSDGDGDGTHRMEDDADEMEEGTGTTTTSPENDEDDMASVYDFEWDRFGFMEGYSRVIAPPDNNNHFDPQEEGTDRDVNVARDYEEFFVLSSRWDLALCMAPFLANMETLEPFEVIKYIQALDALFYDTIQWLIPSFDDHRKRSFPDQRVAPRRSMVWACIARYIQYLVTGYYMRNRPTTMSERTRAAVWLCLTKLNLLCCWAEPQTHDHHRLTAWDIVGGEEWSEEVLVGDTDNIPVTDYTQDMLINAVEALISSWKSLLPCAKLRNYVEALKARYSNMCVLIRADDDDDDDSEPTPFDRSGMWYYSRTAATKGKVRLPNSTFFETMEILFYTLDVSFYVYFMLADDLGLKQADPKAALFEAADFDEARVRRAARRWAYAYSEQGYRLDFIMERFQDTVYPHLLRPGEMEIYKARFPFREINPQRALQELRNADMKRYEDNYVNLRTSSLLALRDKNLLVEQGPERSAQSSFRGYTTVRDADDGEEEWRRKNISLMFPIPFVGGEAPRTLGNADDDFDTVPLFLPDGDSVAARTRSHTRHRPKPQSKVRDTPITIEELVSGDFGEGSGSRSSGMMDGLEICKDEALLMCFCYYLQESKALLEDDKEFLVRPCDRNGGGGNDHVKRSQLVIQLMSKYRFPFIVQLMGGFVVIDPHSMEFVNPMPLSSALIEWAERMKRHELATSSKESRDEATLMLLLPFHRILDEIEKFLWAPPQSIAASKGGGGGGTPSSGQNKKQDQAKEPPSVAMPAPAPPSRLTMPLTEIPCVPKTAGGSNKSGKSSIYEGFDTST